MCLRHHHRASFVAILLASKPPWQTQSPSTIIPLFFSERRRHLCISAWSTYDGRHQFAGLSAGMERNHRCSRRKQLLDPWRETFRRRRTSVATDGHCQIHVVLLISDGEKQVDFDPCRAIIPSACPEMPS